MNILVTGGTGFIGSNLVKRLVKDGHNLFATGSLDGERVPNAVHLFPHSVTGINWKRLSNILNGQSLDVLFHEAANNDTTFEDRDEMFFSNVASSLEIFEKVVNLGCKKIVYASSTAVYGNQPAPQNESTPLVPLNVYGESKELLEISAKMFADAFNVIVIGLRYCNVYGPGESRKNQRASMVYQIAHNIRRRPIMLFDDGEQKRDYIYIDDVVRANLLAMECNTTCVVNCGTGQGITFNMLYEIIARKLNKRSWGKPTYIPNPYEEKYQSHVQCDMTLAKEVLGFIPKYNINTGLEQYYLTGELK